MLFKKSIVALNLLTILSYNASETSLSSANPKKRPYLQEGTIAPFNEQEKKEKFLKRMRITPSEYSNMLKVVQRDVGSTTAPKVSIQNKFLITLEYLTEQISFEKLGNRHNINKSSTIKSYNQVIPVLKKKFNSFLERLAIDEKVEETLKHLNIGESDFLDMLKDVKIHTQHNEKLTRNHKLLMTLESLLIKKSAKTLSISYKVTETTVSGILKDMSPKTKEKLDLIERKAAAETLTLLSLHADMN